VIEKVSKPDQEAVKQDYWAIFNGIEASPGEEAVTVAQQRADDFADKYRARYPRAVDCLLGNLSALTAHLHFPVEHRERVRHSNLLERTFGESASGQGDRSPARRELLLVLGLGGTGSCQRRLARNRHLVDGYPAVAGSAPPAA
jgi:hypothetical protein